MSNADKVFLLANAKILKKHLQRFTNHLVLRDFLSHHQLALGGSMISLQLDCLNRIEKYLINIEKMYETKFYKGVQSYLHRFQRTEACHYLQVYCRVKQYNIPSKI